MRKDHCKQEIANSLRLLVATYVQAIQQLEDTLAVLSRELQLQESNWLKTLPAMTSPSNSTATARRPVADRTTLSIVYDGKSCFLGNTLLFRFFEAIARRPNKYFSHAELLDDVWGGPRSGATIRNVAKRLRDKLKAAGLAELARFIDGRTPGYYVLSLNRSG